VTRRRTSLPLRCLQAAGTLGALAAAALAWTELLRLLGVR
jgi:hypothetical protein